MCNTCGYTGGFEQMKVATFSKYRDPLLSDQPGITIRYCPKCGVASMGGLTNKS